MFQSAAERSRSIMNSTQEISRFGRYEFLNGHPDVIVPCLVVLSLGSVIGVLGNGLILLTVAKKLHGVEYKFVLNLAVTDMFVTLVANPISIVAKLEGERFFDRIPHFCRIVGCLCTIACINSLGSIACLSFNRCIHICYPKYYRSIFTSRSCTIMCVCLYLIGTMLVLLNAAGIGDHEFDRKSLQCIWDRMASYPYTVIFSVTLVWIPIVVVGISFLVILVTVNNSQRRVHNHNNQMSTLVHRNTFIRSVRLAKTFFIIYFVFTVCWIPYALILVIDADDTYSHVTHIYITMWAHLHSSVNWLVYYLTNKKISEAIDEILGAMNCLNACNGQTTSRVEPIRIVSFNPSISNN